MSDAAPKIYVLDKGVATRSWNELVGIHSTCTWNSNLNLPVQQDQNPCAQGSVIVIHRSHFVKNCFRNDLNGAVASLRSCASKRPDLVVVVVSGDDQSDEPIGAIIYFRETTVLDSKEPDVSFRLCFEAFIQAMKKGVIDFALLEPNEVPDQLVAVYVASIYEREAAPGTLAKQVTTDLWAAAKSDFVRLAARAERSGAWSNASADWRSIRDAAWPNDIIDSQGRPSTEFIEVAELALVGLAS